MDYFLSLLTILIAILHLGSPVYVEIRQYRGYMQRTHNDLRRQEGAADMQYMTTDRELELRAQQWVDRCGFFHQQRGYGENLAFYSSTGPTPRADYVIRNSMRSWYNEKPLYRFGRGSCGRACHYTQMVWARTSRMGCAMSYCDTLYDDNGQVHRNAMYFACFYSPPGNYIGQTPYTPGYPCSRCSFGDSCIDGLCYTRGEFTNMENVCFARM
ncbi:hypothetical protein FSP39_016799 [Pinctada imbricata]|uniref:SCP domain-containing protein n=1 Tax=Pinctada imbricata TaxID=66713 RepID=A0AA88XSI9_PINIB|nr:hypothetical protein FSP39_016799 [Pinctada imbricata]